MNALTVAQLKNHRQAIETRGLEAVREAYTDLSKNGYGYASWAEGVVNGTKLTGVAAMQFLRNSYYQNTCQILSNEKIIKIMEDMAKRTMDEYINIAENSSDKKLNRNLNFRETENIHKNAFEGNGLNLDNWTLHFPMSVICKKYGDAAVERM